MNHLETTCREGQLGPSCWKGTKPPGLEALPSSPAKQPWLRIPVSTQSPPPAKPFLHTVESLAGKYSLYHLRHPHPLTCARGLSPARPGSAPHNSALIQGPAWLSQAQGKPATGGVQTVTAPRVPNGQLGAQRKDDQRQPCRAHGCTHCPRVAASGRARTKIQSFDFGSNLCHELVRWPGAQVWASGSHL